MQTEKRHTCIYCGRKRYRQNLIGFKFTTWVTPVLQQTTTHFVCTDVPPVLSNVQKTCQVYIYNSQQRTSWFFFN